MEIAFDLLNYALFLVSPCLIIYAATFYLDIRRKEAFWLVTLALILPAASSAFILMTPLRIVVGSVAMGTPMMLFARDGLLRRSLVVASLLAILLIADGIAIVLWRLLKASLTFETGGSLSDWDLALLTQAVRIAVVLVAMVLFDLAYRRMSHLHTDRGALTFGGFIVVQLLLLTLCVAIVMMDRDAPLWFLAGVMAATLFSAAVDVLLFVRLYHFNRAEQQRERAELLQHELDHYLQQYRLVEREVRLVGRLRHDLRNQSSVAILLAQQGDTERACRHLEALVDEIIVRSVDDERSDRIALRLASSEEAPAASTVSVGPEGNGAASGPGSFEGSDPATGVRQAGRSARQRIRRAALAFPLSQLMVLSLLGAYAMVHPHGREQGVVLAVAVLLCIAVDVVLLRGIAREDGHQLLDERVRMLQEQTVLQEQQYQRLVEELEEARRVRRAIVEALMQSVESLRRADMPAALELMHRAVGLSGSAGESYCENRVVNALVMMKMRRCKELGVHASCTLVVPEQLRILDVDLCAAFSNLLDNAINACAAVPEEERCLSVKGGLVAGVVMIDVVNSTAPAAVTPPAASEAAGLARRHGWGLQILETLAVRYNGTFECGREGDDRFRATLMLMNETRGLL
ncbi:GHKL domain-containing protein [Adlercreutzia equolifaciens]|uniref:GHKL domain-containing protein n=1 Tax=Adlercreutzia equolifaciens TaxID=446660 RepID=UPI0023B0223E|nr:GHKL domain-containing protein [Adlercreutzia equolifaciens]MDE8702020.1 GHKL domain-containing protein [Adlercreutzia equolifaciens]